MPSLGGLLAAAASLPTGNPNFGNFQPIADHTNMAHLGTLSDASNSGTYMVRHVVSADAKSIRLVYSNTVQNEAAGANSITIRAAVRRSDTTTIPVTFNGAFSVTLAPGADIVSDPITCPVTAGDFMQTLTYVSVTSGTWPANIQLYRQFGKEGFAAGVDRTDGSSTGYDFSTNRSAFGPTLVLGSTGLRRPIITCEGDSIALGTGDPTYFGHFERGLSGAYSFALIAQGGAQASSAQLLYSIQHRAKWMAGSTHALSGWGTNDIAGSVDAATVAGRLLALWALRQSIGMAVYQHTFPPNTTSTDSWATAGNQTVKSFESVRVQINDWLRNGAKVDGSGNAVFDGSGTRSTKLAGVVELADAYETARNSGKWKTNGSANYFTADGIHPSTAAHIAGGLVVAAWAATLTVT